MEVPRFKLDHDVQPNKFDILLVELGFVDAVHVFYWLKVRRSLF